MGFVNKHAWHLGQSRLHDKKSASGNPLYPPTIKHGLPRTLWPGQVNLNAWERDNSPSEMSELGLWARKK